MKFISMTGAAIATFHLLVACSGTSWEKTGSAGIPGPTLTLAGAFVVGPGQSPLFSFGGEKDFEDDLNKKIILEPSPKSNRFFNQTKSNPEPLKSILMASQNCSIDEVTRVKKLLSPTDGGTSVGLVPLELKVKNSPALTKGILFCGADVVRAVDSWFQADEIFLIHSRIVIPDDIRNFSARSRLFLIEGENEIRVLGTIKPSGLAAAANVKLSAEFLTVIPKAPSASGGGESSLKLLYSSEDH